MKLLNALSLVLFSGLILSGCGASKTSNQGEQAPNTNNPVPNYNQQGGNQQSPMGPQSPQQPYGNAQGPQQPMNPQGPQQPYGNPQGPQQPMNPQGPQQPYGNPQGPQQPFPGNQGPQSPQQPYGGPQGPGPILPPQGPQQPPMPMDPNSRLLPPMGQPIAYPHCQQYFQGLQWPYNQQPVFQQPQAAAPWAQQCYDNRYDMRNYNQAFYYFSSFQIRQHRDYRPLFNGQTVIRITTAVFQQQGGQFDLAVYNNHYQRCLQQGYAGVHAVQQAFFSMNIQINVQEYLR